MAVKNIMVMSQVLLYLIDIEHKNNIIIVQIQYFNELKSHIVYIKLNQWDAQFSMYTIEYDATVL